jgi:hypothetical protein
MAIVPERERPHYPSRPQRVELEPVSRARLKRAKRSFTTRRVPLQLAETLLTGRVRPRSGDLLLARVDRIGQHGKLESPDGRRALLHLGDEIIVTYADRYAPDQFEAHVPRGLTRAHLVAAGGIASLMLSRSDAVRRPTEITPIGLLGDGRGTPLNVADFGLPVVEPPDFRPPVVAVVGTSMNSGKTTTSHWMVHTLAGAGVRPGATKVTGTGSGGDYWVMKDAGAHLMLDFTDVGLASTFRVDMAVVERKAVQLIDTLTVEGCGAIAVEVADGLFQYETARLLQSDDFLSRIDGFIFAAGESMGAIAGIERLKSLGLTVLGISGRVTRSPLAVRETVKACEMPVFSLQDLSDPRIVLPLFGLPAPADEASEGRDVVRSLDESSPFPSLHDVAADQRRDREVARWRAVAKEPLAESTQIDD